MAAFLVELLWSKMDRERWMATILGKTVIRMCRAIRRLGTDSAGGSLTPSGTDSGSVEMASWSCWISVSSVRRSLSDRLLVSSCVFTPTACCSEHRSHRKSSIYSVFKSPSKHALRVVEDFWGTCRVRLTNEVWLGLY